MTDYFALLDQPQKPWLEPEKLKEIYHARSRDAQPDAQLNEAYQTLRDPKRRLHHLLTLRGEISTCASVSIPQELESLFPEVATVTRETDVFLEKQRQATNTLSRALLKTDLAAIQKKIAETLGKISELKNAALVRLKNTNENDSTELHALYIRFSYLNRWIEQLEERRLQLSL